MRKLYIAYGSNLNLKQMKHRCPTAKFAGTGSLENCALDFRRLASNAYATIHPDAGSFVPVAFWEIDDIAERSLDVYEGYPRFYRKNYLPVTFADGRTEKAMIYIMNSQAVPGIPSPQYIQTIYQGYIDTGLNTGILSDICKKCGFSMQSML